MKCGGVLIGDRIRMCPGLYDNGVDNDATLVLDLLEGSKPIRRAFACDSCAPKYDVERVTIVKAVRISPATRDLYEEPKTNPRRKRR